VRATYALPKFGLASQNVSLAFDDRYFKSDVGFQGTPLPSNVVSSRPLTLRYALNYEQTGSSIGGHIEYVHNLRGGRADSDQDYTNARFGAHPNWNAYRYGIDASHPLATGWSVIGRFRGQYANEPLIPGEQFGVGGSGSVRGLRDREVTGDRGYSFTAEVQAPVVYADIAPFAFFDYGWRKHLTPVSGVALSDSASSLGIGMKWHWQRKLEVSAALARVMDGITGGTPQGHVKLEFSAFYRF
jgi:hemolysin activation/secretion protein